MRGAGGGGTRGGAEARRGADGPGRLEGLAGPVPRRVLGARPVVARVTMVVFIEDRGTGRRVVGGRSMEPA
ncbi:hypothetical protein AMK22_08910 [Streptomyces sp. CB01580]|nr:hypothetical protein AMK22_08910 [Streptomyces sp. CB01580]